jgi:hypothetical protein
VEHLPGPLDFIIQRYEMVTAAAPPHAGKGRATAGVNGHQNAMQSVAFRRKTIRYTSTTTGLPDRTSRTVYLQRKITTIS